MGKRVDTASKLIRASASRIYQSFATAKAMEAWLPPEGMAGTMLAFKFEAGGGYKMRLAYKEPGHSPGKTTDDADEVDVRFVKLIPYERIEQAVSFESADPAFSGTMRIAWILEPVDDGTRVTVRCEDVPVGIDAADHQAGLESTLNNLAAYIERGP